MKELEWSQSFPITTLWELSVAMETRVLIRSKKVSEYDQEIPQSQTADNPVAPRGRAA